MSPERRAEIVKILEESGRVFHAAVTAVPEESASFSPAPDSWCLLQIVEHVAVAEMGMFRLLGAATPGGTSLEDRAKEALITSRATSRAVRASAPDRAKPTGRFANVPDALAKFAAAREQTIRFARETELDLFAVTTMHPLFGSVNGYELLLIMAGHPRRHASQIEELTEHLKRDTAPRE